MIIIKLLFNNIISLKQRFTGLAALIYLKIKKVKYGKNLTLLGFPLIRIAKGAEIIIGDNVTINSSFSSNLVGLNRRTILCAAKPGSKIIIGSNTGLSGAVLYAATEITIGDWVNVGGNVSIYDTDFHPIDPQDRRVNEPSKIISKPVHIKNDVFLGAHSIILKGVTIGDKSVVGAGSVVVKDVPDNSVFAGNPAKYIKSLGV